MIPFSLPDFETGIDRDRGNFRNALKDAQTILAAKRKEEIASSDGNRCERSFSMEKSIISVVLNVDIVR